MILPDYHLKNYLVDYLADYFGPFRVFEFITVRAIAATLSRLIDSGGTYQE